MTMSADLTIDEALSDPLIGLLMQADGVDADALRREWQALARRLPKRRPPTHSAAPTPAFAEPTFAGALIPYAAKRGEQLLTDCICAALVRAANAHSSKAGPV